MSGIRMFEGVPYPVPNVSHPMFPMENIVVDY